MKRFALIAILFLPCVSLFPQAIDQPIAIVKLTKQKVITVKQVRQGAEKLEAASGRKLTLDERKQYLDSLITEALIEQAAERDKIAVSDAEFNARLQNYKNMVGPNTTDEQFEATLKAQGSNLEEFKTQLRKKLLTEKYITTKKQPLFAAIKDPSEDEIKAFFATYSAQFVRPDTVRFNYILTETSNKSDADKAKAKDLIDGLAKQINHDSTKFDEAMIKSAVTGSGYKGGDFGYLPKNNQQGQALLGQSFLVPFSLKVGEVSDVLESSMGYYILKVTEILGQKFLTLTDPVQPGAAISLHDYIKGTITQQHQQQVLQTAVAQINAELRTADTVTVFDKYLNW
jgi:parvulin-like peptidyl-prolyl isomerase